MKTQKIYNLIILDASGSMHTIYDQALTGVNETIATIRMAQKDHPEIHQYLTLASFSAGEHFLNRIFTAEPIDKVRDITREDYPLLGCTALYDAMGTTISELQQRITSDDRVLVTIITDGYENSSHTWSGPQIKALVEELRQMGWTFTYIGADQDVEKVAAGIGVHNSLRFSSDADSTRAMFAMEGRSRKAYYAKMQQRMERGEDTRAECDCYFAAPQDVDEPQAKDGKPAKAGQAHTHPDPRKPTLMERLFGKK